MELVRSGMGIKVVTRRQMPSGHRDPQRCCDITQRRKEPREDLRKGAQAGNSRCKGPGAEACSGAAKKPVVSLEPDCGGPYRSLEGWFSLLNEMGSHWRMLRRV